MLIFFGLLFCRSVLAVFHQVGQGQGLARALGDFHHLIAPDQTDHLHDEEVQVPAFQPQGRGPGQGEGGNVKD